MIQVMYRVALTNSRATFKKSRLLVHLCSLRRIYELTHTRTHTLTHSHTPTNKSIPSVRMDLGMWVCTCVCVRGCVRVFEELEGNS